MSINITRRDALKLGTSAAISAAATPLLASPIEDFAALLSGIQSLSRGMRRPIPRMRFVSCGPSTF